MVNKLYLLILRVKLYMTFQIENTTKDLMDFLTNVGLQAVYSTLNKIFPEDLGHIL